MVLIVQLRVSCVMRNYSSQSSSIAQLQTKRKLILKVNYTVIYGDQLHFETKNRENKNITPL